MPANWYFTRGDADMSSSTQVDSTAIVESIARTYFNYPESLPPQEELEQWKPRSSLWTTFQYMTALLPRFKSRQATVDGHRLRFWEIGSPQQPTVVLLHGFGASKENWLSLALQLGRSYHLLIPDLPGFGESCFQANARYTYQHQAQRLAHWFAEFGIKQAHWVGSSMGG